MGIARLQRPSTARCNVTVRLQLEYDYVTMTGKYHEKLSSPHVAQREAGKSAGEGRLAALVSSRGRDRPMHLRAGGEAVLHLTLRQKLWRRAERAPVQG